MSFSKSNLRLGVCKKHLKQLVYDIYRNYVQRAENNLGLLGWRPKAAQTHREYESTVVLEGSNNPSTHYSWFWWLEVIDAGTLFQMFRIQSVFQAL